MNNSYKILCEEIERLDDIVDDLLDKFDKAWVSDEKTKEQLFYNKYLEERQKSAEPHFTKLIELKRDKKRVMPYELKELPDYGDVMSLDDFLENVECGGFIDYDGFGRYVKDGKMTNISIIPSDVPFFIRKEFKKIVWFNR